MADDAGRLLVRIEATQAKFEKQMAAIAAAGAKAAGSVESKFKKANDNIARGSPQAAAAIGKTSQAAGQLSFQLNDIATSLAGGASPFQVMMQQGSQVTQVFQQMGGGFKGAASVLAGAFSSMLNPISLVSFGFILAAGKALEYFTAVDDGSEDSAKALKKQRDLIREVADAYGDALPALKAFNEYLEAQEKGVKGLSGVEAAVKGAGDELRRALRGAGTEGIDKVLGIFKNFENLNLGPVITQWEAFKKKVEDGTVTVEEAQAMALTLNATLNKLPIKSGDELASGFLKALEPIQNLIKQLENLNTELKNTRDALETPFNLPPLPTIGPPITSGGGVFNPSQTQMAIAEGTADIEVTRAMLKNKAATTEIAATLNDLTDEAVRAFGKLFLLLPETARITSGVRSRAEQAQLYADYKAGRGGLAAPPGTSKHEIGAALDIGAGVDMETLRQAVSNVKELTTLKGKAYAVDKVHVQLASAARKAADDEADAIERKADELAKARENLAEYLATLDEQATLAQRINDINASGLSAEDKIRAIEVETELQKALNLAKQSGLTLTAQEIELIRQKALANAEAGIKSDEIKAAAKLSADALKEAQRSAEEFQQAVQGAVGGLIKDLIAGKDAAEAFGNALQKIADKALEMALNNLFSMGGMGATGGMLGGMVIPGILHKGGVAGVHGYGSGRAVSASAFAGARRYHSGGMIGAGEVPAILKRGELVLPAGAARRGGGSETVNIRLQDDSGRMADIADQRIQTRSGAIVKVSVAQSVKVVKQTMPGLMSNAQSRAG